jgi:flagellar hook-length control protein FliK
MTSVTPSNTRSAAPSQARDPSPILPPEAPGLPSFLQTLSQKMDAPPPTTVDPAAAPQTRDGAAAPPAARKDAAGSAAGGDSARTETPAPGGTAAAPGPDAKPAQGSRNGKDGGKEGGTDPNATNGTRGVEDPALAALMGVHAHAIAAERAPASPTATTDAPEPGLAPAPDVGAAGTVAAEPGIPVGAARQEPFQATLGAAGSKDAPGGARDALVSSAAMGEAFLADPSKAAPRAVDASATAAGSIESHAVGAPAVDGPPPAGVGFAAAVQSTAGSAPAPTLRLEPRVGSAAFSEALGDRVTWMAKNDLQSAELHLNPPDLGPLQVVVDVNRDQAAAFFSSPHADVRQAIEEALPRLREMFAQSGIQLGNASVGSDPRPRQEADGGGTGRARTERIGGVGGIAGTMPPDTRPLRMGTGLVDTFA